MTIQVTSAAGARTLADYLERCGCTVIFLSDRVLNVDPPERAQSLRDAEIEIDAHLRVWRVLHPMHDAARIAPTA